MQKKRTLTIRRRPLRRIPSTAIPAELRQALRSGVTLVSVSPASIVALPTAVTASLLSRSQFPQTEGLQRRQGASSWQRYERPVACCGRDRSTAAARDGEILTQFQLEALPVYDGLIAARGRLFLSLSDGTLLCLGRSDAEAS